MDFVRYITGLVIFLGSSLCLALVVHLVLRLRAKRKDVEALDRKD
jgi:hypothetical protein